MVLVLSNPQFGGARGVMVIVAVLPYYFTHSWRENNWIHTFPKGISAMWNAISLVQDLNSCRRVHFLRR